MAVAICAFEIGRWRNVPDVLPQHKNKVPISVYLSSYLYLGLWLVLFILHWISAGFVNSLAFIVTSYLAVLLLSGILIPLITRSQQWLPFTIAGLAYLPISLFLGYKIVVVYLIQ
ncbi:hypothetical protein A8B78_21255 [Jannaschia sp. EhC01]|nr:hypothetical protein A8B78_21255 [Jannaschia sp. EhC01]